MTWGITLFLGTVFMWTSLPLFWSLPRIARALEKIADAMERGKS